MSNNEMQVEPEQSMFTDKELLDGIDKYNLVVSPEWPNCDTVQVETLHDDVVSLGYNIREAITNCITAIKDEQGEKQ